MLTLIPASFDAAAASLIVEPFPLVTFPPAAAHLQRLQPRLRRVQAAPIIGAPYCHGSWHGPAARAAFIRALSGAVHISPRYGFCAIAATSTTKSIHTSSFRYPLSEQIRSSIRRIAASGMGQKIRTSSGPFPSPLSAQ
jgi:hypothetical protein